MDRWDNDPSYQANVHEQSMDYFDQQATRATAISMDLTNARASRQIIPMRARDRDLVLPRTRIISTRSGGSDCQRLRGTPEYHEACNILAMPGHVDASTRQQGRLELQEITISRELNINPPPPAAPREGTPAKGSGKKYGTTMKPRRDPTDQADGARSRWKTQAGGQAQLQVLTLVGMDIIPIAAGRASKVKHTS